MPEFKKMFERFSLNAFDKRGFIAKDFLSCDTGLDHWKILFCPFS